MYNIETPLYQLILNTEGALLSYIVNGHAKNIQGPLFEVDGKALLPVFSTITLHETISLNTQISEYVFHAVYKSEPSLKLKISIRISEKSPILKLKFSLIGNGTKYLTKVGGESLDYLSLKVDNNDKITEVRFSEFNEMLHEFCMNEVSVSNSAFENKFSLMGPLLACVNDKTSYLIAYEHGSQYPDAFVNFNLTPQKEIILSAKKGNYLDKTVINEGNFETIWFDFGMICGDLNMLAAAFREFLLKYSTLNLESRKPYIFYNTWNFQERNRFWNKKTYLADMRKERMLEEIDAAHHMGVDVFVIDSGWYEKTGDWVVDSSKFNDGMKEIKERLDSYKMQLGLWIAPTLAAVSSHAHAKHPDCKIENDGEIIPPYPVWETEESYTMCLVSDYWEELANTLIRLYKNLGVTYFKWDAVGQYGCTSPHHHHGNEENTVQERGDSYAFNVGRYLEKIVNKVCKECPEVIIEFDITEGHRSVGLGFLFVGKYFLINNGPYYPNYSIPCDLENDWINIFVYPGAPRTWICRSPLTFDKWIPSVLFLTHYLPDDPLNSQNINIASLILGQNGIWGDLLAVSEQGKNRFADILSLYKKVRDDITSESAIKTGITGSAFECYEKINSQNGKGVVCIFSTVKDKYRYVTTKATHNSTWCSLPANITRLENGSSLIEIEFNGEEACIIFFGV